MVKVLDETPPEQAEWILFMQPDTVIDDVAFTFPFEFYQVSSPASSRSTGRAEHARVHQRCPLRRARTLSHWAMAPSCWQATPRVRKQPEWACHCTFAFMPSLFRAALHGRLADVCRLR